MVKKISDVQKNIKLATHGEDYRSWMSNPVFYVYGGLTLVLALAAVLCFKLLATPVPGVLLTVIVLLMLLMLSWLFWIRRQYAFGKGGMMGRFLSELH